MVTLCLVASPIAGEATTQSFICVSMLLNALSNWIANPCFPALSFRLVLWEGSEITL